MPGSSGAVTATVRMAVNREDRCKSKVGGKGDRWMEVCTDEVLMRGKVNLCNGARLNPKYDSLLNTLHAFVRWHLTDTHN